MADKKDSTGYIVIFSVIICAFFSLALSVVQTLVKDDQEKNAKGYMYFNILKVFGVDVYTDKEKTIKISTEKVYELYKKHIEEIMLDKEGNIITKFEVKGQEIDASFVFMSKSMKKKKDYRPVFKFKNKDNEITQYGIPIYGNGLWGPMSGFFSIKSDFNTVTGITFYKHIETPGLGAEVDKKWFQDQYRDPKNPKFIRNIEGKLVDFKLIKGGVVAKFNEDDPRIRNSVDAISGATITSVRLNGFVNKDLKRYEELYFGKKFKALKKESK